MALSLDSAIELVMSIGEAGWKVCQDIIELCHSGPCDEPDTVGVALPRMPGVAGFFGASSIERLPTERAIRIQVESFKSIRLRA